ncbi:HAMP domain-containing sensor histidine kinase, partial [Roseateles sp.]|uniref:sensor histidine kinase n=1 Tax=Roseateles sp. TaxID=1971397 RepID=UPI003263EA01
GDLCQAITDLAVERDAPFSVGAFRTLNRCLDNAIADAVTEFGTQRDADIALKQSAEANERLGFLVHELRNHLHSATLALAALESGMLPIGGSTGSVLKRSLASMTSLLSRTLGEVRATASELAPPQLISLATFIHDAGNIALLAAKAKGCPFLVAPVDPLLWIRGNRELLLGALINLLQNAFKFTRPHTRVSLSAYAIGDRIAIDVTDHCGGLLPGSGEAMFKPFVQQGEDKSGLGLGLAIARRNVEADNGSLSVRDVPGIGCIFTITLGRFLKP